jgi:hypothetical protein
MRIDIHASTGIRTHDPSVWAGEDISCLRPCSHCDRLRPAYYMKHILQPRMEIWHCSHWPAALGRKQNVGHRHKCIAIIKHNPLSCATVWPTSSVIGRWIVTSWLLLWEISENTATQRNHEVQKPSNSEPRSILRNEWRIFLNFF